MDLPPFGNTSKGLWAWMPVQVHTKSQAIQTPDFIVERVLQAI
ncbi:hypothetical protein C943_01545 [Mariniradius saccharolyticus AK6]|uniref:Uncharacterized protein n=1 Tax=Mariniradius saccharolyticus AK6 TaxID=1239962 RepID=M7XUW7_9BACT|nr:hypothetical protein C943_01545 [Mariniradius saccharolyticus AK6]